MNSIRNYCGVLGTILAAVILSGCASENTGSRTIVGEQMSLPELSDSSDSVSMRVYESVKGAKVWTAKDCNVNIAYTNVYTNTYFGIIQSRDFMTLSVKIEPCDVVLTKCSDGDVKKK